MNVQLPFQRTPPKLARKLPVPVTTATPTPVKHNSNCPQNGDTEIQQFVPINDISLLWKILGPSAGADAGLESSVVLRGPLATHIVHEMFKTETIRSTYANHDVRVGRREGKLVISTKKFTINGADRKIIYRALQHFCQTPVTSESDRAMVGREAFRISEGHSHKVAHYRDADVLQLLEIVGKEDLSDNGVMGSMLIEGPLVDAIVEEYIKPDEADLKKDTVAILGTRPWRVRVRRVGFHSGNDLSITCGGLSVSGHGCRKTIYAALRKLELL